MNSVICNEGDETIQECTFETSQTCGPDQAAGVICNNNNHPGKLQLSPRLTVRGGTLLCFVSGVLIAGGWDGSTRVSSAEVFNPSTGTTCSVGDLPTSRTGLSLCHEMACGGWPSFRWIYFILKKVKLIINTNQYPRRRSCVKFEADGTFTPLSVTLVEERENHLCWSLPSGEVLLLGGDKSPTTTERISSDGSSSSADFTLQNETT